MSAGTQTTQIDEPGPLVLATGERANGGLPNLDEVTLSMTFFEAAVDEDECGRVDPRCYDEATVLVEWTSGHCSVACEEHAAAARALYVSEIERMCTWAREASR